jgi:hypothetical protein
MVAMHKGEAVKYVRTEWQIKALQEEGWLMEGQLSVPESSIQAPTEKKRTFKREKLDDNGSRDNH